ncbi:hypothetical protein [Microbacterium sp. LWH3-1.2]|uniref:hypothetical protein n=1 Tax=Microbacterium sp. LWH3-1.2 TaxID=3135256 RepID=UPI0034425A2D
MFRTTTTFARTSSPVLADWTSQDLLEWIGEDDSRCHDTALVGVLAAIDAALQRRAGGGAVVIVPTSPAPFIRAIAARLREEPALRDLRIGDLVERTPRSTGGRPSGDREPGADVRGAASVHRPLAGVS